MRPLTTSGRACDHAATLTILLYRLTVSRTTNALNECAPWILPNTGNRVHPTTARAQILHALDVLGSAVAKYRHCRQKVALLTHISGQPRQNLLARATYFGGRSGNHPFGQPTQRISELQMTLWDKVKKGLDKHHG
jgi:hypothetical protein